MKFLKLVFLLFFINTILICLVLLHAQDSNSVQVSNWITSFLPDKTIIMVNIWGLAVLALLTSLSNFMHFIADKTANKTDDKIAAGLATICRFFGKILDLFTANTRPKNDVK